MSKTELNQAWAEEILSTEPAQILFKKLTKKPDILEELPIDIVKIIFKYAKNNSPKPFYIPAIELKPVLEPIISQVNKYFPKFLIQKYKKISSDKITSDNIALLIQAILDNIAVDYPEQTKKWIIIKSQNLKQKGFKIRPNEYKIIAPAVDRHWSEIIGVIYHEIFIHVLRKIQREFYSKKADEDYIEFEEGLANAVEYVANNNFEYNIHIPLAKFKQRLIFKALVILYSQYIEQIVDLFKKISFHKELREQNLTNILSRSLKDSKNQDLKNILDNPNKKINSNAANYYNGMQKLIRWAKIVSHNPNNPRIQKLNADLLRGKFDPLNYFNK